MRLVLDTNVWIDWLVFDDPAVAPLKAAQRGGRTIIIVDDDCLRELGTVLAYPEFGLDDAHKAGYLAEVARCTARHEHRESPAVIALPRCSDPDDQKFMALALDAAADWLLTRDKALLRLNRRLESAGFRVGSVAQWLAASAIAVESAPD
jgi:putative PIN family toxin of toxin-antitoxin system